MKTLYITLFMICSCLLGQAQLSKLTTADKKYKNYSYIDAIDIYQKVVDKGYKSPELFKKLGNSYYFNGELDQAAKWYGELFALGENDLEPEYYFRYSQALKANGDYKKANTYLELFNEKTDDSRGKRYAKNKDYLNEIDYNSGKYTIDTTSINSEFSDYGLAPFGKQFVFSSARKEGALYHKIHDWTDQNFTDLYSVTRNDDGTFTSPENFSKEINTKFNESTPTFTKDGKTMYFTRNNFNNGKKGKDDDKSTLVKIYKASFIEGKWKNIEELPFNSNNYSTAHPVLSKDEKTLYFASDMPGGFGNSDIYKVSINGNSFGKPENLGKTINTEGRESFPFVDGDNNLYFASDGQLGLGGLDIFKSEWKNGSYQDPVNLAKPINSSMDDFAFIIDANKKGYFTSNREGGKGYDDIYSFKICQQTIFGIITDIDTDEILPGAAITLYDSEMNKLATTTSNDKGYYEFLSLDCQTQYNVRVSKEEYETTERGVTTAEKEGKTEANFALKRNVFPVEEGTDLAKIFDISIIYFDLDKWNIRSDAAKDLQKIVEVMKQYPNMEVSIRSHTDSRQTHRYNEILSDRRAKSTLEFMVKNGIQRSRLTAKGYGETELVNNCSDGVPCSEAEHQKNRRSEFIVTKMN
jgi:outer membrane protein OmpA-like peptidoglycan-associated protein/tetratricopeptide (TPR) repeat protein